LWRIGQCGRHERVLASHVVAEVLRAAVVEVNCRE
jgi:hypothetical protein